MEHAYQYSWIIPFVPLPIPILIGIRLLLFPTATKNLRRMWAFPNILLLSIVIIFSVDLSIQQINGSSIYQYVWSWTINNDFSFEFGYFIDSLTSIMSILITTVGIFVLIYSDNYMSHDQGYLRFFAYMSLFNTSMLGLVTSSNLIQIYIFWELVGMCSYLLIGFWFTRPAAANACQKAFVTNRIGDFGLLLGILGFYWITGSFEFQDLFEIFNNLIYNDEVHFLFVTLCASLLFAGAVAKSAQFPLHVWLPDAMEGPFCSESERSTDMAISDDSSGVETPLLEEDSVDSCLDYKGRPVDRTNHGGWKSATFIIGVEIAERFAYCGIDSNLVTYLTGPLGQSTATAAVNVNTWSGTAALLPLLGAFIADSFLGRYRTIIAASLIYILGLGLLTLSAALPSLNTSWCEKADTSILCSPQSQVIIFFFSLYLVAFGQGGHKPCVQAFGADQFDAQDPEEFKAKSSFFNWWYFGLCSGTLIAFLVLNYIQDNLSWVLGFGIPCIIMVVALVVFLCGTTTYRYSVKRNEKSPFVRIGQVFVLAVRNWRTSSIAAENEAHGTLPSAGSKQYKFLNKALLAPDGSKEQGKVCSIREVEEAKAVLRLVPIWATSLVYAVVLAQSSTFFTKQGATMDRSITTSVKIPAASLQSFISLTIVLSIPIYDRIFVPLARVWSRKPAGITMLQRIGSGMFLSTISMILAALTEMKRLRTAQEYALVDEPEATVPMSVWWLVPQYVVIGLSEMLTMVGLQEFFYDQVPNELKSIGLALYLSIFGVGNFLSGFLVSAIDKATGGNGGESWFPNNLNKAHLHYFYWLLVALSAIELAMYFYFAKSYIYNRASRPMQS